MRVLQIHTAYREPGGEDVVVTAEAGMLRDAGHEVVQRIAYNPTGARSSLAALTTAPWRPRAARAVRGVVDTHRPDIAAVHNTWFALSPSAVHEFGQAGVPVVMTLHQYRLMCPAGTLFHHGRPCFDCVGGTPWHAVAHRCYRGSAVLSGIGAVTVESWRRSGALDAVDRFVVMTESGRDLFVRGGLPADRIVVRPHGVADPGLSTSAPSASDTLVFVGRAVEEKGLDWLLTWWGSRTRQLVLEVIGEGPVLDRWRECLPQGVRVRGTQPRAVALEAMRRARAVIVPSVWEEPFGLVAIEAMASGVGVASTGVGGLSDIHGTDAGWTAPAQDHDAWDSLIEGLNDDVVDAAGAAGRRRYERQYSLPVASASLIALYDDVRGLRSGSEPPVVDAPAQPSDLPTQQVNPGSQTGG